MRLGLTWNWKTFKLELNKQAIKRHCEQQQVLFLLFASDSTWKSHTGGRLVTPERKSNFAVKGEEAKNAVGGGLKRQRAARNTNRTGQCAGIVVIHAGQRNKNDN